MPWGGRAANPKTKDPRPMRRILKSLFGGGAPATAEVINPGDQVVIADGRGTLGARGGRLSPRDQIDALVPAGLRRP